jgi:glycosyltransferase involved in cell wall biosynthesis
VLVSRELRTDEPLVSIGIVTKNQEKYIEECLESIRNQTYKNIEVYVSDDASDDATFSKIVKYCKKHPDFNCTYFVSSQTVGIAKNCNKLLDRATGKYVQIFSGDDIMMPDKIATQVRQLQNNPDAIFSFTNMEWFWSENNKKIFNHFSVLRKPQYDIRSIISDFIIPTPTLLIRRELLGKIRYNETIEFISDFYFVVEMMTKGKALYDPYISVRYRKHKSSSTYKSYFYKDRKKIIGLLRERFPLEFEPAIKNYSYIVIYAKIMSLIQERKKFEAIKLLPQIFPAAFSSLKWVARTFTICVQLMRF